MSTDTRLKDLNWPLKPSKVGLDIPQVQIALLMDIRDRLDNLPLLLTEVRRANEILQQPWLTAYLKAIGDAEPPK